MYNCHLYTAISIQSMQNKRKDICQVFKYDANAFTTYQDLSGDEIEEMIREADLDGDGKVGILLSSFGKSINR